MWQPEPSWPLDFVVYIVPESIGFPELKYVSHLHACLLRYSQPYLIPKTEKRENIKINITYKGGQAL